MAKPIPTVLKDAEVYREGNRFLTRAKSFSLPGVATKTEAFEALATGGDFMVPLPGVTDDLEGSIAFAGEEESVFELLDTARAHFLEVLESRQRIDPATGEQVEVKHQATVRALFNEYEPSERERAQADGPVFTFSAVYYSYEIDGTTVLEIDKLRPSHKVLRGGELVDLLAKTRTNLGLD